MINSTFRQKRRYTKKDRTRSRRDVMIMGKIAPIRPLPMGMSEYCINIVLDDHFCGDDAHLVLAMNLSNSIAVRTVKHEHIKHGHGDFERYTTSITIYFGAYDDEVAHHAVAPLVQRLHAISKLQGVILRSGARMVVTAHAHLK